MKKRKATRCIILKSPRELELMRVANRIVAEVLNELSESLQPGISTHDLDRIATEGIIKRGAVPAFKGYRGYPASLCVSVNDEVVHGIPSPERIILEGDLVSMDLGSIVEGYYGDAALSRLVGSGSEEASRLIEVTVQALCKGIERARPRARLQDISWAIQEVVEKAGFSIVRQFVGHGIGRSLHEPPEVPNFGRPGQGPLLKPGMVFAIEPMVNAGGPEVRVLEDGWTAVTVDGSLSAHWEHSVAITENGPEILSMLQ